MTLFLQLSTSLEEKKWECVIYRQIMELKDKPEEVDYNTHQESSQEDDEPQHVSPDDIVPAVKPYTPFLLLHKDSESGRKVFELHPLYLCGYNVLSLACVHSPYPSPSPSHSHPHTVFLSLFL